MSGSGGLAMMEGVGGGSSAHSLRTRWTPLHTHFLGRCVEEHNQLMAALNRAVADAGPHSNLANNAKVRGMFQALLQRKEAVYEFIARHRQVYGDLDAGSIASFEGLLDRLHAVDERVQAWDQRGLNALTPRAGNRADNTKGARKTITFSPSADAPSSARHTVSRPSARQPGQAAVPSMHDLMSSFSELERVAAVHTASSKLASHQQQLHQDHTALRQRWGGGSGSTTSTSTSRNVFAPAPAFGRPHSASLPPAQMWTASDPMALRSAPTRSEPSAMADVPRPPRGYLYDFTVASEEVKRRINIQHEEFIAFDALHFQMLRGAGVSVPDAPLCGASSADISGAVQALLMWQQNHTWKQHVAFRLGLVAAVLLGLYVVVVLLLEVEALLDTLRPHGSSGG